MLKHCTMSDRMTSGTSFYKLPNVNVTKTSLTGTKTQKYLRDGLQEIGLKPMELDTYNLNFLK